MNSKPDNDGGDFDMCKAITDLIQDGRAEAYGFMIASGC